MEEHIHCKNCIKWMKCIKTPDIPGESCKIISCPLDCGAKYHGCKGDEHRELCMNEKVPCINAEYGCPSIMFRKHRSKHLPSCPASIIHCSEEWDRWPIHFHKKGPTPSQAQLDSTLKSHLDVSLAMRDQRMLRRWCFVASHGQQPLSEERFTISPSSSLWIFRKWRSAREYSYPPGLQQSVCNELCKVCKKGLPSAPIPKLIGCSNDSNVDLMLNNDSLDSFEMSDKENSGDYNNIQMDMSEQNSLCKLKMENNNEIPNKSVDDLPLYNLDDVLQLSQFGTVVCNQSSGEKSIYVRVDPAEPYTISSCLDEQKAACQILNLKFRNPSSTPPWCLSLGLDLNLESRSLHPPSNFMYSFLCSQEFRRDQYGWHFKNVHSEIHGGLNGWLIERCPLAQYGCKFARRRFNPEPKHSDIVYNENLESFGITYSSNKESSVQNSSSKSSSSAKCPPQAQSLSLLDMPFDVLQHIVRFLDSFSLANVSLTSTLLRDVCSTILKDRGLVHLKWEKVKLNGKNTWRVAKKQWFFSSHFSPIHRWTVESKDNMSNHLKTCPYFNRISQKKAFGYEHYRNSGHELDKRFCDPYHENCEHNTTKL